MKKYEIHLSDLNRILFGTAPVSFLVEVAFRTIVTFLILLTVMRLMGKRMSGKLDTSELAVMLTLGGIVSVPMQVPERGILQGVIILVCCVVFERGVNWYSSKNKKFNATLHGKDVRPLVKDGLLERKEMFKTGISIHQLFAQLREKQVINLGSVERLYLEASGAMSVFLFDRERPGLSVLPEYADQLQSVVKETDNLACRHCGYTGKTVREQQCPVCHEKKWETAII